MSSGTSSNAEESCGKVIHQEPYIRILSTLSQECSYIWMCPIELRMWLEAMPGYLSVSEISMGYLDKTLFHRKPHNWPQSLLLPQEFHLPTVKICLALTVSDRGTIQDVRPGACDGGAMIGQVGGATLAATSGAVGTSLPTVGVYFKISMRFTYIKKHL